MDNQNNNFKPTDLSNLPKMDLLKDVKFDINQISMQSLQPQLNIKTPNYNLLKKEEPKPKTGIEGWYERNNGKVNLGFQIFGAVMTLVAIVEGYVIYLLSK